MFLSIGSAALTVGSEKLLFDERERTALEPKNRIEGDWSYLDRSARPEARNVREFLGNWIAEFPSSDRTELVARFRSGDDRAFASATFEVVLYALFRRLNLEVEVHPELPGSNTKHPDFLVTNPEGESTYVEAVLASEYNAAEIAARNRTAVLLQSLERIDSPNFFVGFHADGDPERPPRGKVVRNRLKRWLDTLNPDEVGRALQEVGHEAIPKITIELDGWTIEFQAFPRGVERRVSGQRVIGAISSGVRVRDGWTPIRDAVKAKGNKYGKLQRPLLVAVNVDSFHLHRIDEMQALFGQEEFVFNSAVTTPQPQMRRKANGVWNGPKGPQYTRVSGTWLFNDLNAWNISSRRSTVYFNPWATLKLPTVFNVLPNAQPAGTRMTWSDGSSLADILGIDPAWPE